MPWAAKAYRTVPQLVSGRRKDLRQHRLRRAFAQGHRLVPEAGATVAIGVENDLGESLHGALPPGFAQRKRPAGAGPFLPSSCRELHRPDVRRLLPFGAGRDVEGYLLVLFQALESRALDRRKMREKVLAAAVGRDEAVALRIVEPLDGSCCHVVPCLLKK